MSNNRFKFRVWNKLINAYEDDGFLLDVRKCRVAGQNTDIYTLEQCTGLKDKKGKLIFEGDVVRTAANKIGVVKWVCNRCKFEVLLADNSMWLVHETQEIIGNIHERRRNDETV